MGLSGWHLLILALIAVLIFGGSGRISPVNRYDGSPSSAFRGMAWPNTLIAVTFAVSPEDGVNPSRIRTVPENGLGSVTFSPAGLAAP